ncbi:transglycosylase domain-containing protein, partial [Bacteroides heparinolyticus]
MKSKIIEHLKQLSITRKTILIVIVFLVTGYIFCLPGQLFQVPYSTVVADRHGALLGARIASDGQWRFPPRTTIPDKMKQCLIMFEDKHFYHHWGVNPLSIGRAIRQNLKNKHIVSGGSTLTMQTIRLAR